MLGICALRSYLDLICEHELHSLPNKKVNGAKDHGENFMKVRAPLVRHLLRNRLDIDNDQTWSVEFWKPRSITSFRPWQLANQIAGFQSTMFDTFFLLWHAQVTPRMDSKTLTFNKPYGAYQQQQQVL